MSIFKQIKNYFSVYEKYIGRRLYIVFILSGLAAITEGFGIAMLLPLIDAADIGIGGESGDQTGIKVGLQTVLNTLGIGSSMVGILLFIAMIFLLKGAIIFLANAYQSYLRSQLMCEIKELMFNKYSSMDYNYYSKHNTGHFINIINAQINSLVSSFDSYKLFLTTVIMTTAYLGMAFLLAWKFAFMALVAGILLLFLFRGLNNYVHDLSRKTALEQSTLNRFLVQTIQSFKYLSSTAQLDHLRKGIKESILKLANYMRSQGTAQALTTSLSEPIAIFFVLLVITIQVAILDAPLGPIFVALVLFNRSMGSILGIQKAWQNTLNKIGSLEIVEKEFRRLDRNQEVEGTTILKSFHAGININNVTFAYDKSNVDVLHDISITIPANSTVAFVGESGAGKSTLVDLLTLILRPRIGDVFIDGVSSRDIVLSSWRQQIGYVSQETVIFDDSIANNICLWKDDFIKDSKVRERIEFAAKQAYAEEFIRNLPDQYNTVVGDRGVRLSGGQRQRLFLARELYKCPRLLILDEATSALDSESERYTQESIELLKGKTTVVIIAHRLSTIKHADYIYVLDSGRIVEQGLYEDLMNEENSRFNKMVKLQSL